MKTESEINVFVNGVLHYFNTSVQQTAECGTPHLAIGRNPDVSDYTGMIKISGKRSGMVFFTAPKGMLSVMLMRMQETDSSDEIMRDLVGEIANTISGNARRDFGKNFLISIPTIIAHEPEKVTAPHERAYVIPINWRTHSAKLVVCLE